MKRIAVAVVALLCLAVAACQYKNPFSPAGQGYPDDPKAGESTDVPPEAPPAP